MDDSVTNLQQTLSHNLQQTVSQGDIQVTQLPLCPQISLFLLTKNYPRGRLDYDEMMASQLTAEVREGFYSSNTYFMTVDTTENRNYLSRLAEQPGVDGIWPQGNGILIKRQRLALKPKAFSNRSWIVHLTQLPD